MVDVTGENKSIKLLHRRRNNMPYIPQNRRKKAGESVFNCKDLGELCYHITDDILGYMGNSPHWQDYAGILGMLESIKMEIYRRLIADHEDVAIERNGDVFDV